MGHALMENRHGLVVGGTATLATGMAERQAALELLDRRAAGGRVTLAADKAYDVAEFVAPCDLVRSVRTWRSMVMCARPAGHAGRRSIGGPHGMPATR